MCIRDSIQSIIPGYREKLELMLEELSSFPEGTRYTAPEGGLFIFVETVSYTHLDVYKRQPMFRPATPPTWQGEHATQGHRKTHGILQLRGNDCKFHHRHAQRKCNRYAQPRMSRCV